jgi:hypothetical protein
MLCFRISVGFSLLLGVLVAATAASLFGDFSCKDWSQLEYSRKKTWANAFLAPLSLTIQGLTRLDQDPYNDNPDAFAPAIQSIDQFCAAEPHKGASDGAASYLSTLTGH